MPEYVDICLEISRLEYEHSFRRAEKLDNKVYILLTVCGFVFVMLVNALQNIGSIDIFSPFKSWWIFAYDLFLVIDIVTSIFLLWRLIHLLSGMQLKRYDSNFILEYNMLTEDNTTTARFTIMHYEQARDYNNALIDKRYKLFDGSIIMLILLIMLLVLLNVISGIAANMNTCDLVV